jgi:hypothetical protein
MTATLRSLSGMAFELKRSDRTLWYLPDSNEQRFALHSASAV